jgi:hypothetical protein
VPVARFYGRITGEKARVWLTGLARLAVTFGLQNPNM